MNPTLKTIYQRTNKVIGVDIKNRSRKFEYVFGRSIYYKIAREFTGFSYSSISQNINRDHATILHAMKNFNRDILGNESYFYKYNQTRNDVIDDLKLSVPKIIIKPNIDDFINKITVNDGEMKLLSIYRDLSEKGKIDLIFKADVVRRLNQRIV